MPKAATYEPVGIRDADLRKRIIEAGDANFWDAAAGKLFVKRSAAAKWGFKKVSGWVPILVGPDYKDETALEKKLGSVYLDHDITTIKGDAAFHFSAEKDAHYKALESVYKGEKKSLKDTGYKEAVIRDLSRFADELPKDTLGIYLDLKHLAPKTTNEVIAIGKQGYNFCSTAKDDKRLTLNAIPGMIFLDKNGSVIVARDKVAFHGYSYVNQNSILAAVLISNYGDKARSMLPQGKITADDVLNVLKGDIHIRIENERKALKEKLEGIQKRMDDQIKSLAEVTREERETKEALMIKAEPNIEDIRKVLGAVESDGTGIVYTLTNIEFDKVKLPDIRVELVAGKNLIEPKDKKLKNPAPWLWWDEAKKDYTGPAGVADAGLVAKAAGGDVLSIIDLIQHLNRYAKENLKDRYEAFIKENGGEHRVET